MIIQGTATSHVSVTTNVQGSGTVSTHIQSTVNGVTKTLNSDQPGTYTLDNNSNDAIPTPQISWTPTPISSPTPELKIPTAQHVGFIVSMRLFFHQTIQKLLSIFHL